MSRILVTGSTQGIGLQTATDLIAGGHSVVLHARTQQKADAARAAAPGAAGVVVGDLATFAGTTEVVTAATEAGPFDVVVHNAGMGINPERVQTADGLSEVFAVNVVAPYVLTALLPRPQRLVFLSSGVSSQGRLELDDLQWESRPWDGMQAYSDSKLADIVLAFWVARHWSDVRSNALDPGWIKTRMGGAGATGELSAGAETPVWLAGSDDQAAQVSGRWFVRKRERRAPAAAGDEELQEALVSRLEEISGVSISR